MIAMVYAMTNYPSVEQLAEMAKLLTQGRIENWLGEALGSWRWWTLVILLIAPWLVWFKLANKKQLIELTLFGLIVMVLTITMDWLGFMLSLWNYPVDFIPLLPRLSSVDYTVVPIVYMLTYQHFSTWKSYFWALTVVSAVFAFIVEPIIAHLGFYVLIKWLHWYSFIIYIIMGLFARWIARKIVNITQKANLK